MTISTYAELKTSVADFLNRNDLTSRVPDFITMFEACANRRLRTRQMETITDLTPSSGAATLPSDYLAWRRATWTGSTRVVLEYTQPEYFHAAYPDQPSATPRIFTIENEDQLKIMPIDDTDIEFSYYQKIPVLSDSNTSNWLLAAHPDLYVWGAVYEGLEYGALDESDERRCQKALARREALFNEIALLSNKTRGIGAIRVMGATP